MVFGKRIWRQGIYQQHHLFFSKWTGLNLHYFSFFKHVCRRDSVIPAALHPFNIISLPFKDSKNWYASFMTLACRDFKTESCKSTFIVVTSRVESSFSASIIEELKYLLKALFSIFFELAFVLRTNGCHRRVMFFGTITDSVPCFDRTSDILAVDWALKASHIRKLFW